MISSLASNLAVKYNQFTDRTLALPVLVFFPTARCNSRCVSCDWWKSDGRDDLTRDEIESLVAQLPALGVRLVVFSGGEPLLRRDVFELASLFRSARVRLSLLTAGLFLERDAARVARHFEQVTISLDGPTPALYRRIRGVDGLALVERGVQRLHDVAPSLPVRARSTLHRHNFRELPHLIDRARALGLAQISFLAADVTSEAFGRSRGDAPRELLLSSQEVAEFREVVEQTLQSHAWAFENHFVAESPARLRRLPAYYAAQLGEGTFPPVLCNAPWASAVVEADGAVRPCYFHPAVGNVRDTPLQELLGDAMRAFRQGLDVTTNATCQKCVCTLNVGLRTRLW